MSLINEAIKDLKLHKPREAINYIQIIVKYSINYNTLLRR